MKPGKGAQLIRSAGTFAQLVGRDQGMAILKLTSGEQRLIPDVCKATVGAMKREFKVEANVGAPQVAYRETFSKEAEIDYTHKKQSGGG